jgi:hypothetical protein
VVFATYLATVELLAREIETAYPGQGVVVLRGGDHGMKVAAEKRFRRPDGPCVLICTAAGREGINLQFSRVLFNFDLPWNPMDVEQRIGRIHRYGQKDTAQVYNLVLSDTIEGRIYLLLTDKLNEIARTLGKVDAAGNVTEDLGSQILGQLNDRLSYDQLYRDALDDPELKRTREELEAAMSNAREARQVVFELFQDLDRFSLDDYRPLSDVDAGKTRLLDFLRAATAAAGGALQSADAQRFELRTDSEAAPIVCTLDRDLARADDSLTLLGIDHPLVRGLCGRWQQLDPADLGACITLGLPRAAVLSVWLVRAFGAGQDAGSYLVPIAVDTAGRREPSLEKRCAECFRAPVGAATLPLPERTRLLYEHVEPMLRRELGHRGIAATEAGVSDLLLAWLEIDAASA